MILALETSTRSGGVAIVDDGKLLAEEVSLEQKSHSENINPFIERCLQKAQIKISQITAVAVSRGPGSFTGLRVAGNAAKVLSYTLHLPLIPATSLEILAAQTNEKNLPVLAMINAYKNMVYYALFDVSGNHRPKAIIESSVIPVRQLDQLKITSPVTVVGDGFQTYSAYFPAEFSKHVRRETSSMDEPRASTLGMLASKFKNSQQTLDWKSFTPLYIRASEAEENKKGILFSPL